MKRPHCSGWGLVGGSLPGEVRVVLGDSADCLQPHLLTVFLTLSTHPLAKCVVFFVYFGGGDARPGECFAGC